MARLANIELQLIPGSLTDDTDLAAKLHAIDMDKVRFRGNRAETIKAWEAFNASGMSSGTARGIHTYTDLDGVPIVVAASESAVNAWMNGTRYVITPLWRDVWLDDQSIEGTSTVTWIVYNPATDTGVEVPHGLVPGDVVTFSNAVRDGGGSSPVNGTFTITSVPTPTTFVCASLVITGTDRPVAAFTCTVAWKNGLATGTGDTFATRARVWSIDNFGENAVFCGSDGTPVFVWQPKTDTSNKIVNGNFSSGSTGWGGERSTGWTITGGLARSDTAGPNDLAQDVSNTLKGGAGYQMSFTISGVASDSAVNSFRVRIDDVDIFPQLSDGEEAIPSGVNRTYTFRFTCPANPKFLIFTAGAEDGEESMVIQVDNISIAYLTTAFPLSEAPYKNLALFVDANRILSVLGSVEHDGDFDPGLWRWCDQDNYREWVSNTDNVAGELPLGKGSYAVCGAQVGERILILTDAGAFAGSFAGLGGYSVRQVGTGCGAVGTRSLAVYNNRAFWAGENAFYAYDGTQISVIECPNKDRYVGKLALYQASKTYAWINIEYGEVWFHYAHTDKGTEISDYQLFAFIEQSNPWSFGTFNRTCMAPASIYNKPIGIDTSGAIWTHETGIVMSGSGIALPRIKTGYLVGQAGDRWVGCRRYYPDIEHQVGNIKFTVTGKRAPQGQNNTQSVGPLLLIPDEAKLDFVLSCRQLQFEWESESSTTSWRLGVVGLEMTADKERR